MGIPLHLSPIYRSLLKYILPLTEFHVIWIYKGSNTQNKRKGSKVVKTDFIAA